MPQHYQKIFTSTDEDNGTTTKYSYFLDIVVDKNVPELIRTFPVKYSLKETDVDTTYTFPKNQELRRLL